MLNPLRLVLETFGSALGGSLRRSLLSMLNIFEPFRSSPSLGGNNEKRTTRLHTYEPVIRARGQLERLSTIDREQLETNLLGPGMWGPQTSWRTFLHRPSDPLVDEDMAVEQDQVSRCKWIRRMASEFWYNSARQEVEAYDSTCFDAGSLVISEQRTHQK
ncbi:hypothetical protein D6C86_07905 [Aureobasidium pullulans]|uniref:Uncharacterized protein n=1 Tax=Aureobasidium pullulans TaxID=5580 RepID=A0A4S9WUQ4_AURPU|nr:hypothetical protein D6C94_09056 [Aureobasidium pullulans]THZ38221.1 hypothetical protein D6C87_07960 [Aureobasidium pullulans]THZ56331.1 hypothetical protein D6C86_07905 [Aureobasidium pullulans]THZ69657.1 hypothetical protein D6C88_07768 [Aureobasidium pullulans]